MQNTSRFIADIVSAGLSGDRARVEMVSLSLARAIKKDNPELSDAIYKNVNAGQNGGPSALRGIPGNPIPTDSETHLEMAQVFTPLSDDIKAPIFNEFIESQILGVLNEWANKETLLKNEIKPVNKLLLTGNPGTGKTMLAKNFAGKLDKSLVILDLSSSISNLLGKTGHNIKKVLNYAKQNNSVLLLDEFDAIAKKRDDDSDLGEIKRVVNVLLMELEEWPSNSMVIATSNHPELLDRAIWRRFDLVMEIPIPTPVEAAAIFSSNLFPIEGVERFDDNLLVTISTLLVGKSAADIVKFSHRVKKRIILKQETPLSATLSELEMGNLDKKIRGRFCHLLKQNYGSKISVRKIADLTGLSVSGVQHHLKK